MQRRDAEPLALEPAVPAHGGQVLLLRWAPGGTGGWRAHHDPTTSGRRLGTADLQAWTRPDAERRTAP